MRVCHACGAPVPDGARFCPNCGAPQQVDTAGDEARRVVTILFADLVGFTSLSEDRDPESVKRLVERIFEQLVRDVEAHGGIVDKVLGDAIVALFGAPVAHEDDADRAVRAALAMQRSLDDLRRRDIDDAVQMRVGINTGEVLVGTLAGTDYTAMGDVVNIASRLQEVAHPGSVLVGQATRDLCSPAIRLQRVDAIRLRGREQETVAWRALAVETTTVARRWRSDVAFVGREGELGMLGAVTSRVTAGRGAIVSIAGEAGIGKTRLVSEALEPLLTAEPHTLVLEGACASYGESNVWWPVAGGLLTEMRLDRNMPPDDARRRTIRRLAATDDFVPGTPEFERAVELVMHLLGLPSALDALGPAGVRDAVVGGMVDALRRRATKAPVVLWVDDIQWAAPVLLELLETVARQLAGLPLLIVTTCRPGDGGGDWPPPVDPAMTLHLSLEPLPDAEAAELVGRAAGRELPDEVISGISSRSGGNPLFLIELARLAAASDDPEASQLPGTLRALVAARLDQLSVSQRQMLDNAAILGNAGRVESLRQFAGELGQQFDPADLAAATAIGLMQVDGSRWQFRSDVICEVAYETLTKQARAQRHAGVAGYLAAFEPGLVDRRAHHLAAAAELQAELGDIDGVPATIRDDAVRLLADAAQGWVDQGALRRAVGLVERALALGVDDADLHGRLLMTRAEALVDLHDMRPARLRTRELADHAQAIGSDVLRGEAERLLGEIDQADGELVPAREHLGEAVAVFRQIGDVARLAEALRARGFAELFGGSLADGDEFLAEAEELFARVSDPRGTAWVMQHRAWVSFLAGDHDESERRLWRAIDLFSELEDRAGVAWSQGLLGYVYHFTRRNDEALAMAADVIGDARRWGDEWGISMMSNLQGSVWLWQGRLDDARSAAERSLVGFRRIDDRFGMIQALSTLNRVYVALGRTAEADRSVEEVMVLSGSFGEMAYPLIAAAGTAMHQGQGAQAVELSTEAVERLDTTGANVDEGRVIGAFGHLLAGDVDGALARLLDVDVERSPFALAARATSLALLGDADRALADTRAVESAASVSYWDRTVAQVAGAVVAVGSDAGRRRSALAAEVPTIEDVVVRAYASAVLEGLGGPVESSDTAGPLPGGWARLAADLIATAAAVSS